MRWLLLLSGCVGAGFVGLVTGVYATFPSEEAGAYAEHEFHKANKDYALEVGDVRPWWLPGVSATDVKVYSVKKGRKSKDQPEPPMIRTEMIALDALAVRLQVLPRLMGKWSFGYSAELLGGAIDGSYAKGDAGVDLDFTASALDLSQLNIQKDDVSVQLSGKLVGESDLTLDSEDVKNSKGFLEFSFDGLQLAEGSKVMGLDLPVVTFTEAKVRMEAQEGKLVVTEGKFDGDVLDMTLSGDIALNKKVERSRNRLDLAVTLPEDLDKLARIAPQMKRARDEEGAYHFSIGGTLLSPTFRPGRGSAKGLAREDGEAPTGGGPRLTPGLGGGGDDVDPEAAREERRKRREERIAERRERLRKRREEGGGGGGANDRGSEMDEDGPMLPPLEPIDEGEMMPRQGDDEVGGEPEFDRGEGPNRGGPIPDIGPPGGFDGPPEEEF